MSILNLNINNDARISAWALRLINTLQDIEEIKGVTKFAQYLTIDCDHVHRCDFKINAAAYIENMGSISTPAKRGATKLYDVIFDQEGYVARI